MRRFQTLAIGCLSFFAVTLASPSSARAMDRPTRSILVMSGYGIVGGTVLGLASYPFTHNPRTIFMGTSIGLYMGLAVGVFYALNDYSPETAGNVDTSRLEAPDQDLVKGEGQPGTVVWAEKQGSSPLQVLGKARQADSIRLTLLSLSF